MAYSLRGPGSRSLGSSRGSDAPPGTPGKPVTGQSQAGAWDMQTGRCTRCTKPQLKGCSPSTDGAGTGEPRAWKACMRGSEEGRGKRAELSVPRLLPILLLAQLPRPGGDDAGTGSARRSYHDLPLGAALCSGTGKTMPTSCESLH